MYRRCATRGDAARHPPRTVDGMTVGGTNARLRPRNRSAMVVMLLSWNLMNCYGSLDYIFGKRMVMMFMFMCLCLYSFVSMKFDCIPKEICPPMRIITVV